jgi:anaerobic selenocysteine-containing dehydrogenase
MIRSPTGRVDAPIEITDDVMPGVVCLPHGWGHDAEGSRLSVAGATPGVNMNRLVDGTVLEPLSGNARLNGVPVRVDALRAATP